MKNLFLGALLLLSMLSCNKTTTVTKSNDLYYDSSKPVSEVDGFAEFKLGMSAKEAATIIHKNVSKNWGFNASTPEIYKFHPRESSVTGFYYFDKMPISVSLSFIDDKCYNINLQYDYMYRIEAALKEKYGMHVNTIGWEIFGNSNNTNCTGSDSTDKMSERTHIEIQDTKLTALWTKVYDARIKAETKSNANKI